MQSILPTLAFAALAMVPATAFAYDEPERCYTTDDTLCNPICANTFYNPASTENWAQTRAHADPEVMTQLAGTYYGRIPDPSQRMTNETYRKYDANGLWEYSDQTCSIGGGCSQNQGAGLWAGYRLPDGSIFLMIHFSDAIRSNTCFSQTLQLGDGGFYDVYGGMNWQRRG